MVYVDPKFQTYSGLRTIHLKITAVAVKAIKQTTSYIIPINEHKNAKLPWQRQLESGNRFVYI